MRLLYSAAAIAILAAVSVASVPAMAQVDVDISLTAPMPPPPLPVYEQPPLPGPDYLWTPGYWSWANADYYWVPGTWIEPPQPGLLWTPGYWGWNGGVYAFHGGYWGPHVGFYGGVPYGYGYDGLGYHGGYWQHGNFFYNRTVNNFGTVNVTNVYSRTVIVNRTTINTISYNGGPHGATARPTAEQAAAEHEGHVPPTPVQVAHVHAASTTPTLFSAANHGHPAVAATAHPGVFTGRVIVPAAQAGAVPTHPGEELKKPVGGVRPTEGPKTVEGSKPLETAKPGVEGTEAGRHGKGGLVPAVAGPGPHPVHDAGELPRKSHRDAGEPGPRPAILSAHGIDRQAGEPVRGEPGGAPSRFGPSPYPAYAPRAGAGFPVERAVARYPGPGPGRAYVGRGAPPPRFSAAGPGRPPIRPRKLPPGF